MKDGISRLFVIAFLIVTGGSTTSRAQQLPSFDIYLVGMRDGQVDTTVHAVENITDRPGFDNHPSFSKEGAAVMYVSDESGSSIDIYRYNIKRSNKLRMSYSDVNEFSPRPLPVRGYSAIIEESDGKLRLWSLTTDVLSGDPVLPEMTSVGYYAWIDNDRVALFVLGESVTLQIAEISTGKRTVVASNIGRSLYRIPGTTDVSFVHKKSDENWIIKRVNPDTGSISEIAPVYGDGEDYTWTPDGKLLMASGAEIFEWIPESRKWTMYHDFSGDGVGNITRLAVSPDDSMLAFVADR
jgi:WD40-like Beta Propeller Repeat